MAVKYKVNYISIKTCKFTWGRSRWVFWLILVYLLSDILLNNNITEADKLKNRNSLNQENVTKLNYAWRRSTHRQLQFLHFFLDFFRWNFVLYLYMIPNQILYIQLINYSHCKRRVYQLNWFRIPKTNLFHF